MCRGSCLCTQTAYQVTCRIARLNVTELVTSPDSRECEGSCRRIRGGTGVVGWRKWRLQQSKTNDNVWFM